MTADVWLVTQVSGLSTVTESLGMGQTIGAGVSGGSNHVARNA